MRQLISFFMFLAVFVGCGSESPGELQQSGEQPSLNQSSLLAGPDVNLQINAPQQCIESLTLTFNEPIVSTTLMGRVVLTGTYNSRHAFRLQKISTDARQFTFTPKDSRFCYATRGYSNVILKQGVRTPQGWALGNDVSWSLPGLAKQVTPSWRAATETVCSSNCVTVTKTQLNAAYQQLLNWEMTERQQSWYRTGSLQLLPTTGTILGAYSDANLKNHYGNGDITFTLRRAAKFVEILFPGTARLAIADLSNQQGRTPSTSIGTEVIYAHPEGSHMNGQDADITYLGMENGAKNMQMEKNFWLTYILLQSTSVDIAMTAYRDNFISMAQKAYEQGYITDLAWGRFNVLSQNTDMNHDAHLHISLRNANNSYQSLRFTEADDAYSCYLSLNPRYRGGTANFCL